MHLHIPVKLSQIPFPEQSFGQSINFYEQSLPIQLVLHLQIPVKLSQIPFPEQSLGHIFKSQNYPPKPLSHIHFLYIKYKIPCIKITFSLFIAIIKAFLLIALIALFLYNKYTKKGS